MPAYPARLTSLVLAFSLAGCSTLESAADHTRDFAARHPIVTAVGTAVVIGGAVAALDHRHHKSSDSRRVRGLPCPQGGGTECRQ